MSAKKARTTQPGVIPAAQAVPPVQAVVNGQPAGAPSTQDEIAAAKARLAELQRKEKESKQAANAPLRAEYDKLVAEAKARHTAELAQIRTDFVAKGLTFGIGGSGVMSDAGKSAIAEGTRLYIAAGKPTKAQLLRVYGEKGAKWTWLQRAKHVGLGSASEAAEQFQAMLAAKS
jgi:hypothetical protein